MEIHERIKCRRKEIGLSAEDVAAALGVSRATVYRYESKDIEKLPLDIVEPLAAVLRCSIAYIMGWEEKAAEAPVKEEFSLSELEKNIIRKFRTLNNGERSMFLRSIGVEEEKGDTVKMA